MVSQSLSELLNQVQRYQVRFEELKKSRKLIKRFMVIFVSAVFVVKIYLRFIMKSPSL